MLSNAIEALMQHYASINKPYAVIVAGHNGSGKSTMWKDHLADKFQIPLINADRMMMSILPEPEGGHLTEWAKTLRDEDQSWMEVARQGVQSFIVRATAAKVPFATETVFSEWRLVEDHWASKIDLVKELQIAGYFVILVFVGLSSVNLSIGRVSTRVKDGGHNVPEAKLISRFPKTQMVISKALDVVDAAILCDNSRDFDQAFTVCHVRQGRAVTFDIRNSEAGAPSEIEAWMSKVVPL